MVTANKPATHYALTKEGVSVAYKVFGDRWQGRGIAVNIGSRVSAKAGASEVLVSSTVGDLVAGSGLVFEDAGEHDLKGIPNPWRLCRLLSG